MPPSLRKAVAAAIGGGAIAIASVLITGPSGNDGLEGVSYIPAYSALFDHGLASKSDQRFASIRSTGNLTFSTAF